LILGRRRLRGFDEHSLHVVPRKLLHEQHLISILSAQPVRRINQNRFDLSRCRQIAHLLQTGTDEARAAKALIFDHPFVGNAEALLLSEGA
jgi:hypothetical protein